MYKLQASMPEKPSPHTSLHYIYCFILIYLFATLVPTTSGYLLIVNENQPSGDIIFNASVYKLGSERHYKINAHKSAAFVHRILFVNPNDGQVILKEKLECDGLYYPNLFTVHIDSTSNRLRSIDYYSLPLRIFIIGEKCATTPDDTEIFFTHDESESLEAREHSSLYQNHRNQRDLHQRIGYEEEIELDLLHREKFSNTFRSSRNKRDIIHLSEHTDNSIRLRISEAKQWISETYASFAIPTADKWQKICLKKSQFINSIAAFMPKTISAHCEVTYLNINDPRFRIEHSQGDLVASYDLCITEPLWKVIILFNARCQNTKLIDSEHRLKIVYHHQEFNDTDIAKRVRRELRNQSPFFEQALYVASVLEECDPGVIVTTVKARDPENSPVKYSMTSLLDSRTQKMFDIDSKLGTVTTKVKLDRELIDVHYFRIKAEDDSFPPRSGTTTLQINVLDANDHSPVFEMNEYEASIREGVSVGTTVITIKASDQDIGKNAEIEYSIVSISGGGLSTPEEDNHAFRIDGKTGVISTRTELDRETTEVYTLIVQAQDMASPQSARRSSSASVVITILDYNDNYPQFTERTYTVSVNEDVNWAENPVVAHVKAYDADQGNNAAIRYGIIGGNTQSQFSIDSLSGDISLVKPLDYETLRSYRLVIRAQDGGSPSRSNTTQVLINVKDVNDNAPRFYTSLFQESVSESVPIGYSIVRVQAYDADEGLNAEIKYSISARDATGGSSEQLPVTVDARTGWIYTTKELDREVQSKFMFHVLAVDQGDPPQSASASVLLTVQDVNDNDPTFEHAEYEAVVAEDDPPGTPVASVTASDPDEDPRLHYEITGGNTRGRFSITTQNGRGLITIAQPLDYKQERRYVLTITASDSGGRHDTTTVHVNVSDANNFAPVFENAPYTTSVFEDAPIGTTVLVVSASDNDVGINAQITYTLGDENSEGPEQPSEFTINPQTGAIITTKVLDRETTNGYLLTVTARDGGSPSLSDTTDVEISVSDVNDNYPVFKQAIYTGNILEDALIGTSVVQVSATDADIGLNGRIKYTLSAKDVEDGSFVMDPASGVIRTNKGLDRESVALYQLEAIATDRGTPALSSTVPVNIRIEDVNDNAPTFESDKIVMSIPENSPIGSTVGELHAHDPDEGANAIVQYSIIGGEDSNSFSLITRPGSEKAELITMTELDFESPRKQYDLIIRAASPPLRTDVHVQISVLDVNDNAPVLKDFHVMFNNFKDCFPSGSIGMVPATDADVTDQLMFRVLSGNNAKLITLNQTTGQITLSPQLNTNVPKIATMEVSVTDGVNEVKALMQLSVRLVTEAMLLKSVTVRLNDMTEQAFLSPLLNFFIDGLAAIIPCPKENVFLFNIQDDTDVNAKILNVSFSARRPDVPHEEYYSPQFLQERVYLNRAILARLSTVQVLPFDDNLCVREPCLNYENCVTVLKFGNASDFIHSDTVLFRPIYPVTTFACKCPFGFTGSKEHYLCDTEVNLCYSNPCQNGGTCLRREGGFSCSCKSGFTGTICDIEINHNVCQKHPEICRGGTSCIPQFPGGGFGVDCAGCSEHHFTQLCELKARSFQPGSFLTFPSLKQRHRLHINLRFATLATDGLLLYNGRYNEQHDFIALEIVDRGVEFSFSLGSNITRTRTTVVGGVSDGEWHTVVVNYINKTATVTIDECDTELSIHHGFELGGPWACANFSQLILDSRCSSLTETCHRYLDLTGPLQLGGLPSIPASFQVQSKHFSGCISDLHIDHKFIDLNGFVADNGSIVGCPEKRMFCLSQPCLNGGTCTEGWATYQCDCASGFAGKDCGEEINEAWQFSGDGVLSFNPLLRPIQLPWLNALSVRTRQQNAFLMSIQVGQNSSAVISIRGGHLVYTYNGESLNLESASISDGEWHHIDIRWLGTEIALNLDYDQRRITVPFPAKIQGLYVGKILIGGPDSSIGSLYADYGYFEGCIQDVRVGTPQNLLKKPTVRENVQDGCSDENICGDPGLVAQCPAHSECIGIWRSAKCNCLQGFVGPMCQPVCTVSPCYSDSTCIEAPSLSKGYRCECNTTEYSGEYCEIKIEQPCPGGWWGHPVCGPCQCNEEEGYHPDCNKTNGQCYCKENHYQPVEGGPCLPCDCYSTGSFGPTCDQTTGQCQCRPGVIGRRCQDCPNPYAEVTLRGCEVVYDGCPRNYDEGLWWPRTSFGEIAEEDCPSGAIGRADRACDNLLGGWQEPNMFNCTSEYFIELRKQLHQLGHKELEINTYVAVKLANELYTATNLTENLYGADVYVTQALIKRLLIYERLQHGLTLTHSQDKDYIQNIIKSASVILNNKYYEHWREIEDNFDDSLEDLVKIINIYTLILSESQHDTYTNPFEVISPNIVLGLDIITAESLYGYEPEQMFASTSDQYTTERIVLPDTSSFLKPGIETYDPKNPVTNMIAFPKYNNYMQDKNKFDPITKFLVPLQLLGIKPPESGEIIIKHTLSDSRAVVSYVEYRQIGSLLPKVYDESVIRRWGIDVMIGSPIISLTILKPDYVSSSGSHTEDGFQIVDEIHEENNNINNSKKKKEENIPTKVLNEINVKIHENDASYLRDEAMENPRFEPLIDDRRDTSERLTYIAMKNIKYSSLNGMPLDQPIRLQMWLNLNENEFSERSNPQCVQWSTARGIGEWSRVGCVTELSEDWIDSSTQGPILINCTCNVLSTYAVLVDVLDLEYIPEPSLLEDISSYSSFCLALPLLFIAWIILALLRGANTNSNAIHKNLVACVFLAELLYFIALKARKPLVELEVACKLTAMGLHYLWLAAFSWTLVDAIHLNRMLTEMRDVNHGQMRFYYSLGYALPAVIVGLAVGVRADQYGNVYFCWLSIYESVVWSLVGPICILVAITLFVLIFCVRAAFTLKDHVMGFGNLRTLLWVSVVSLPLLGVSWVLAVLSVAEHLPILSYMLSAAVLCHAIFCLIGYCFINKRVRQNLLRTILRCMGKKVPLLETTSLGGAGSTSSQNIASPSSRSALAYHNTGAFEAARRHIGISTSSTTSRSTTKTSSSPYSRSDTHLRHTSTSTSNYNSTSDVPSYLRGFEHETTLHRHREVAEDSERRERRGATSDSDSDGSDEGRSLELASSHSSDDDESSNRRTRHRSTGVSTGAPSTYLPNITENVVSGARCSAVQAPPALNIVTNPQLFPNIKPMYAPRWSSQLPDAYLPNCNVPEVGRWSAETGSDNEIHCHKTNSPNPLPHPDMTPETYLPKNHDPESQYMVKTQHYLNSDPQYISNLQSDYLSNTKLGNDDYHVQNKLMASHENFHDYSDRYSETEEKQHLGDKYLFPYTAEEDHCGTVNYGLSLTNRMMSPMMINDINNPGLIEYQHGSRMGSRIGSVMGSVHGSVCGSIRGGSPSPLVAPGTMLHTSLAPMSDSEWCWAE